MIQKISLTQALYEEPDRRYTPLLMLHSQYTCPSTIMVPHTTQRYTHMFLPHTRSCYSDDQWADSAGRRLQLLCLLCPKLFSLHIKNFTQMENEDSQVYDLQCFDKWKRGHNIELYHVQVSERKSAKRRRINDFKCIFLARVYMCVCGGGVRVCMCVWHTHKRLTTFHLVRSSTIDWKWHYLNTLDLGYPGVSE